MDAEKKYFFDDNYTIELFFSKLYIKRTTFICSHYHYHHSMPDEGPQSSYHTQFSLI